MTIGEDIREKAQSVAVTNADWFAINCPLNSHNLQKLVFLKLENFVTSHILLHFLRSIRFMIVDHLYM